MTYNVFGGNSEQRYIQALYRRNKQLYI